MDKLRVSRGMQIGDWAEKGKGIKKYKFPIMIHKAVMYSTGNRVNK